MENSQAALLTLGFLLFLKGSSALVVTPVTDPVISKVGDNAMLEIKPPGVLVSVVWFFSPAKIPVVSWTGINPVIGAGYENRVTLNTTTGSVELRSVNLRDDGVYMFQGTTFTSGRERFIGSVTLRVYEPITNVNVKPSLAQPIANQALNLTCEVLGSQTVSSRLWLKDSQPLSTSDRITLSVDSSVVSFNPVLQSDNGEYQCKASNPVSEVTSAGYRLEVNYGPEQASITAPDSAAEGSSVTFTCSAQSLPPCNYTWYFNETETAQGLQYNIASVTNADRGSYTCVAWNSVTGRNTSAVKEFIVTGLGSLSSGEIAGIVICTLAGVTGVALGVYFSVKLCRNNPHDLKPGPAQSSTGAVTYENFKGPSASATYENTTAIRIATLIQETSQQPYSL
ncbi:carcinoembryonic antigen-related cell adhesion molecule 5-like [Huso huso]|uniref:Carcinoembryonic antigen-related cell adhesion molecule 5-like n=1 Tax=Huso huso TaxID=61971 RepID=A0ABR0YC10_HUSHU